MNKIILASHGNLSVELKHSLEMIMGEQPNIKTITLTEDEGDTHFLSTLDEITEDLSGYTVFTDLLGGTPCNVFAKKLMETNNFRLYAGMNLPMIIQHLNNLLIDMNSNLVQAGRDGLVDVGEVLGVN